MDESRKSHPEPVLIPGEAAGRAALAEELARLTGWIAARAPSLPMATEPAHFARALERSGERSGR